MWSFSTLDDKSKEIFKKIMNIMEKCLEVKKVLLTIKE